VPERPVVPRNQGPWSGSRTPWLRQNTGLIGCRASVGAGSAVQKPSHRRVPSWAGRVCFRADAAGLQNAFFVIQGVAGSRGRCRALGGKRAYRVRPVSHVTKLASELGGAQVLARTSRAASSPPIPDGPSPCNCGDVSTSSSPASTERRGGGRANFLAVRQKGRKGRRKGRGPSNEHVEARTAGFDPPLGSRIFRRNTID